MKMIFAQSLWSFWNNSGHILGTVEGKKAARITIDFLFKSGAHTLQEIHEARPPRRQVAHFDSRPTRQPTLADSRKGTNCSETAESNHLGCSGSTAS
ncbi:MAG: hypothetical protein ACKOAS_03755, partial [Verrucomicrobiota bacterium]